MSNFPQQADRIFTILDTGKLTMWAPNGEGKFSSLKFNVNKKNQISLTIFTNIPSDTIDDGKIKAVIDPDMFYAWMQMVERFAADPKADKAALTYTDKKFIGPGRMTDGPVEHYTLIAGRDDAGIVYISITAPKRPNIKFGFLSNTKNMFRDGAGNEMDKGTESSLIALGRVKLMREYMLSALDTAKQEIQRKPQQGQGGGQGGGWNRGGGQGGSQGAGGGWGGGNQGGSQSSGASQGGGGGDFGKAADIPW